MEGSGLSHDKDIRPVPDPTALTTQQLYREISAVRELTDARFVGTDCAVSQLRFFYEEKFRNVEVRFTEILSRAEQTSAESNVAIVTAREASEKAMQAAEKAVVTALQAAKEAVAEQNKSFALATSKSEATTTKQIDQIGSLINATVNALNDKIDDIRARLTTIEGSGKGSRDLLVIIFTLTGIGIAAVSAMIAFANIN